MNKVIFFILGIASGMPLALSGSTLSMRLIDLQINKSTIGALSILGFAYSLKFLYSPILDYFSIPFLKNFLPRRRDWLLLSSIFCGIGMLFASTASSSNDILLISISVFVIALSSTIFDISSDALRIEVTSKNQQGFISSIFVYGYRVGMLITGGFALFLADKVSWKITYLTIFIIYISISLIGILLSLKINSFTNYEPIQKTDYKIYKFKSIFLNPFMDLLRRPYAKTFLLTIALFKITDAYVGHMMNPFLTEIGFSKTEIATIVKGFGFFATLIGSGLGGWLTTKLSIGKIIIFSLILQIFANQLFIIQNYFGHNAIILSCVIAIENCSSAIGNIVLVFLISRACNLKFSGTQYAVISSVASFSRGILSLGSGFLATNLGWNAFFFVSGLMEIPCILIALFLIRKKLF